MTRNREKREKRNEKKKQGNIIGFIERTAIFAKIGKQRFVCPISKKPTTRLAVFKGKEVPVHPDCFDRAAELFIGS